MSARTVGWRGRCDGRAAKSGCGGHPFFTRIDVVRRRALDARESRRRRAFVDRHGRVRCEGHPRRHPVVVPAARWRRGGGRRRRRSHVPGRQHRPGLGRELRRPAHGGPESSPPPPLPPVRRHPMNTHRSPAARAGGLRRWLVRGAILAALAVAAVLQSTQVTPAQAVPGGSVTVSVVDDTGAPVTNGFRWLLEEDNSYGAVPGVASPNAPLGVIPGDPSYTL